MKFQKTPNSLRKHRRARGLNQKEVSIVLGVKSPSMVSRWEKGVCIPKLRSLFKLAVLYRTMADALYLDLRSSVRKEIRRGERKLLKYRESQALGKDGKIVHHQKSDAR